MININQIIENSRKKLKSCFYKIGKDEESNSYFINEYNGPIKSVSTMICEGWIPFPKEYLNDITIENPFFDIDNYKYSKEENKIVRKTQNDFLRNELKIIQGYLNLNQSVNLKKFLNDIKSIFLMFDIKYTKFNSFNDLMEHYNNIINNSPSLNINEKTNYLVAMSEYSSKIYNELKNLGIFRTEEFFNKNFKYFLVLIN